MSLGKVSASGPAWSFAAAGLQAGIPGALMLILWLAMHSAWIRSSVWTVPNLLATTFYGEIALEPGFGKPTFADLALLLVIYGALGGAFGLALRARGRGTLRILLGIVVGIGWYYLSFGVLSKAINPTVTNSAPARQMIVGHILYGGLLSRFPRYL